jgi:hypothetical protein
MSSPTYARLASKVLAPQLRSVAPTPAPSPEARAAAIAVVTRAIEARARKRQMVRWTMTWASAAAVVAVMVGSIVVGFHRTRYAAITPAATTADAVGIVAHSLGSGSSVVVSGAQAPLAEGGELSTGSRVVTPAAGRVALTFSTGTRIVLDESTDMTVGGEGSTQAFRLDAGSIDLKVAKLEEKHRFLVDTPDTEVEVRGTQFRVSVVPPDSACGAGAQTRVSVTEGVVVVRRGGVEVRVAAGEEWPNGCARVAPAEPPAVRRPRGARAGDDAAGSQAAQATSTLGEQNDLYHRALVAKKNGNVAEALDGFDRVLRTYPSGPLAENAMVERMRLLRTTSPEQAEDAAIEYLTRYPRGFAHAEAEAVVRGSP